MESNLDNLMKQYEIMVNSAIQVTNWRQNSNNFFLAVNTALLAIAAYLSNYSPRTGFIFGLTGIILAITWVITLQYFKNLNKAKFLVIHEIEEQLPIKAFQKEYMYYKRESQRSVSNIECVIPCLFGIAYGLIIFFNVLTFLKIA
jgi:hypothetical protein